MTTPTLRALGAIFAITTLLFGSPAQAQTATTAQTAQVATSGSTLLRNGDGVRSQGNTDLYRAALYLGQSASSFEQVLQIPGTKRLELKLLRDVSSDELSKLFSRGVDKSAPRQELSRAIPGLIRMSEIFSKYKRLQAGDVLTIDWIPSQGTVIGVKGQAQGAAIPDSAFFSTLLGIWLGNAPVDAGLKASLLGAAPV